MFCYFNNGLSFKSVESDYVAQSGEVLFSSYATSEELKLAFPEYNSASSILSIKLQIIALEDMQTDRRIREAILGTDNGWLANLNSQIASLRSQLS